MNISHCVGFPRIGKNREYKRFVESYWQNEISQQELLLQGKSLRRQNWLWQQEAGLDFVSVGDFAWYDHILRWTTTIGVIPDRFNTGNVDPAAKHNSNDIDLQFRMARGRAPTGKDAHACEMTKWFNTNYHYIVPEPSRNQSFRLLNTTLLDECLEARDCGHQPLPVIPGPLTWLFLSKGEFDAGFDDDKLELLPGLLVVYRQIFELIADRDIGWIQVDEPALVLDLPLAWKQAYRWFFNKLNEAQSEGKRESEFDSDSDSDSDSERVRRPKILLTTYFDSLGENTDLALQLPCEGLHVDCTINNKEGGEAEKIAELVKKLPGDKILSLGVVNGRNVWKTNLRKVIDLLKPAREQLGDRLWIGPSCSLLHTPVDLESEEKLNPEIKSWLAFARQKLVEINVVKMALNASADGATQSVTQAHEIEIILQSNSSDIQERVNSHIIHNPLVQEKLQVVNSSSFRRNSVFSERKIKQAAHLRLPLFPTTTIGSFPQTRAIRKLRSDFKRGEIAEQTYSDSLRNEIADVVAKQESLGLDVLVHGEPERNDMVEYFGELLDGFAFTQYGWVQSYGSRCVKPPILYGDVSRIGEMTVGWIRYAQSLTRKPMKGMLTGPVTILCWSFVRDDQPLELTCRQIAVALREEVIDLEKAGISIIQIDEPALREGLPLKRDARKNYLNWAVACFQLCANGVSDDTQIHTHMCYAEFNDIIDDIAKMDVDVITLEASRSKMDVMSVFKESECFNEFGPGVWDIHSPQVPNANAITDLLKLALTSISAENLWVNPDCGLKTRGWQETEQALRNLVTAATQLRREYFDEVPS